MKEDETPDRIVLPDGFVEYRFSSVPRTDEHPEGVRYAFQYVVLGEEVLRYDNSHGVHERHHAGLDEPEVIEWSGSVEEHLRMFLNEVEELLSED